MSDIAKIEKRVDGLEAALARVKVAMAARPCSPARMVRYLALVTAVIRAQIVGFRQLEKMSATEDAA